MATDTAQGFTNADISLAVVSYFVGTITALLVLGRLSGHLGRRPTSLATLALLAAGCVLLLNVHGLGWLIGGRLLMGLGAGLASSALTSYIVDAAPSAPSWVASVASSQAPMLGLTLGAVGSGALVQYGPLAPHPGVPHHDRCVAGLREPDCGESRNRTPHTRRLALLAPPRPPTSSSTPSPAGSRKHPPGHLGDRRLLPSVRARPDPGATRHPKRLGHRSGVLRLHGAQRHRRTDRGTVRSRDSSAARHGGLPHRDGRHPHRPSLSTLPLFVAGSLIAGGGQGIAVSATIRGLLHRSTIADRSPIFAAIYLLSYTGAAVPSLIAGQLSHTLTMTEIALGYGGLALAATLITVIAARNPEPSSLTAGGRSA